MVKYKKLNKTELQIKYNNMYSRCYQPSYHKRFPAYVGCQICDEWLNDRELFYDWVNENYYEVGKERMDLDKDILKKGNKIYSPDTCIFAPHSINVFFETLVKKDKKSIYIPELKKYKMDTYVNGKTITLGFFENEELAKKEYAKHKQASIIAKADDYRGKIPKKLYNAMLNWKIEPSDLMVA